MYAFLPVFSLIYRQVVVTYFYYSKVLAKGKNTSYFAPRKNNQSCNLPVKKQRPKPISYLDAIVVFGAFLVLTGTAVVCVLLRIMI